jgi:hypothetical protein
MKTIGSLALALALTACMTDSKPGPSAPDIAAGPAAASCDTNPRTVTLGTGSWTKTVSFPASGRIVLESHLATPQDQGVSCPASGIEAHLDRSCAILKSRFGVADCGRVFTTRWHRQWTPPEGNGQCGQGSTVQPPVEAEMFIFNMMTKRGSTPPAGEKWLLCNDRTAQCVVAAAGYEIGPNDRDLIGGAQGEVLHFLTADNGTTLTVKCPLRDQSVGYGPISCSAPG